MATKNRNIDPGAALASGVTLLGKPKLEPAPSLDTWIGSSRSGNRKCFGVEAINVTIAVPDLKVYVAREYEKDSCEYKIVHAHEKQHLTDAWKAVFANRGELRELLIDRAKKYPTPSNALVVASEEEAKKKGQELLEDVMWPAEGMVNEIWADFKRRSYETDWIGDYIELNKQIDDCSD